MSWLPKSRKARRRLTLVAAIAPVLALAAGLTLWGLSDSITFFYTPSQAQAAKPPVGRSIHRHARSWSRGSGMASAPCGCTPARGPRPRRRR